MCNEVPEVPKPAIYELSKQQLAVLRQAASGDTSVFAVLTPNPAIDQPSILHKLQEDEKQLLDFLELGLAEDISDKFKEPIAICVHENKRSYRVLALTEAGKLMFNYCDDPKCNDHEKGDPCKRLPC
jgi:hypothetical protein